MDEEPVLEDVVTVDDVTLYIKDMLDADPQLQSLWIEGEATDVFTSRAGHLFFSLTSFEEKARYKGELTGNIAKVRLTINVIVYGVEQGSVERAVQEGLRRHFMK